jgi:hypothetical protein
MPRPESTVGPGRKKVFQSEVDVRDMPSTTETTCPYHHDKPIMGTFGASIGFGPVSVVYRRADNVDTGLPAGAVDIVIFEIVAHGLPHER